MGRLDGRKLLILIVLATLSCGDGSTEPEPLPPAPGFVAGRIVVAEDPTQPPGWGFGPDMFGYMAGIHEGGADSGACDRPCNEVAVAMGSDTVFADRRGQFFFENVEGDRQHRIHVVEAHHPRKRAAVAPSTFWHYVIFDTVTVTTAWADTVEVVLDARQVGASITVFIGAQRGAPRFQGYTDRISGVTVTLFASDGSTVLERRMTDGLGEVVFRPLERHVTYYISPEGGYDSASYACLDRKDDVGAESVGWHVCTDLNAPPWTGGSGDRTPGSHTVVVPPGS